MKEKLLKTIKYFIVRILPIAWVIGFVNAMIFRHDLINTSFILFSCLYIASVFCFIMSLLEMKEREIKSWYYFISSVTALLIMGLSMWVYIEL